MIICIVTYFLVLLQSEIVIWTVDDELNTMSFKEFGTRLLSFCKWFVWLPAMGLLALGVMLFERLDKEDAQPVVKENVAVDVSLAGRIKKLIPDSTTVSLGMYVYDLTAGKEVFSYRADNLMSTASNMKLLTLSTAIHNRGLHFPFYNSLYYNGVIHDGTLYGDVCIKLDCDPVFNADSIGVLMSELANARIRTVKGRIILDTPLVYGMPNEAHWAWHDLKMEYLSPVFRGVDVLKSIVADRLDTCNIAYDATLIQQGTLAPNSRLLRCMVDKIETSFFYTMKNSSNINAESLLYTIRRGAPVTRNVRAEGAKTMESFIKNEIKEDPEKVSRLHDGCGLCPEDKLTARFIVQLLRYGYNDKEIYTFFNNSMPLAGKNGTLRKRMKNTPACGKIRAKTGRLTRNGGVSSLSGYAEAKNGHTLAFSILVNGVYVSDANRWQDRMCQEFVK